MEAIFLIIITILIAYLFFISWQLIKLKKHYTRLVKFTGKTNLAEILEAILIRLKNEKLDIEEIRGQVNQLVKDGTKHVQRVGIVRFNPFTDTGGDQSFVIAILEGTNSGIVLTSLHNRGGSRWYAKKVRQGKGVDIDLSDEEKKAIKIAQENQAGESQNS